MTSFLWGAATSGHQIEGNNVHNDWWQWEAQGFVEGGVRSGIATDHWKRFREDLKLASDLGLNSYRFSIEWSRIEPKEGTWNREALDWYRELINECEKQKLLPMATLHHFTIPQWFSETGGFAAHDAKDKFTRFVKHIAGHLGSRIPLWCTLNEPMVYVVGAYLGKFLPPGRFLPKRASAACRNLLKAHVSAYEMIHRQISKREGPWKNRPLEVGIAHNLLDFHPDRPWHPIEAWTARIFHRFFNLSWLDALAGRKQHFGVLGIIPYPKQVKEAIGRVTADFIGVNYYTKAYVQWHPLAKTENSPSEIPLGLTFCRRKEPASDLGWAIHPKGLAKMIRVASAYKLPLYITENGIADRKDHMRKDFLKKHLFELAKLIHEGIDIRGYYYWSLLDNFEWIKGFWPRFGLYAVEYQSLDRTVRKSALYYKQIIEAHRQNNLSLPPQLACFKKIF
ncbi:MAG: glycoside hydrolase family 1 protein [Deltaproteobacteria bacterium]|nr:glycoside hydrolase family 1 protein [Deltaproteobacteria bacterium]